MAEYIEREAVVKKIKLMKEEVSNACAQTITGVTYLLAMKHALDYVSVTPSADVAPVRHGRWINHGRSTVCSECGEDYPFAKRNYCPNCGAKMDAV